MSALLTAVEAELLAETTILVLTRLARLLPRDLFSNRAIAPTRVDAAAAKEQLVDGFTRFDLTQFSQEAGTAVAFKTYFASPEFTVFLQHVMTGAALTDAGQLDDLLYKEFVRGLELSGPTRLSGEGAF